METKIRGRRKLAKKAAAGVVLLDQKGQEGSKIVGNRDASQ